MSNYISRLFDSLNWQPGISAEQVQARIEELQRQSTANIVDDGTIGEYVKTAPNVWELVRNDPES